MANQSQNWESEFRHLMREEEAPLPFKNLTVEELPLLLKFIATNREQITLPTIEMNELDYWNYTQVASILIILKNNSVLHVIDDYSSFVIQRIRKLRFYQFGGSWFDSLESIIVNNVQNDHIQLINVETRERYLKSENDIVCEQLESFRREKQRTDLTSEHADMLDYRIKCFELQSKEFESELAIIMEKIKVISAARKSLNFFYP